MKITVISSRIDGLIIDRRFVTKRHDVLVFEKNASPIAKLVVHEIPVY